MPLALLLGGLALGAFAFAAAPTAGTKLLLRIAQGEVCQKKKPTNRLAPDYARLYDDEFQRQATASTRTVSVKDLRAQL